MHSTQLQKLNMYKYESAKSHTLTLSEKMVRQKLRKMMITDDLP